MKRVGIIGAGLGGLSAASSLITKGYEVSIFEREKVPGGRARRVESKTSYGTYLTEIGPTVFTVIDIAEKVFRELDVEMSQYVEMIRVDPSYRGIYADGTTLDWPGESKKIFDAINDFSGLDQAQGFQKYSDWLAKLEDVEFDNFVAKNFSNVFDLFKTPGALVKLLSMGAFRKMDKKVESFISDPRLVSMSTFQALYAGVTPSQALAVYCIISYMDLIQGVYYPKGGMCAYAEGLSAALLDAGVKINFDSNVTKVNSLSNGRQEICVGESKEAFDAIICNADLAYAYPEIFNTEMPRRVAKGKYSPSCLLYVAGGVADKSSDRAHHTIHFSGNDKRSYDELVNQRVMMTDPSFLISNPNVSDPSIVPDGSDVFYVLEPCPHLDSKVDFENNSDAFKERMRGHLTKSGINLTRVDTEIFIDPIAWDKQGMYRGTPFSLAHTFLQSGPFRSKNRMRNREGIFFAGTATTPGVGIPMVLESGRLACELVDEYLKAK